MKENTDEKQIKKLKKSEYVLIFILYAVIIALIVLLILGIKK